MVAAYMHFLSLSPHKDRVPSDIKQQKKNTGNSPQVVYSTLPRGLHTYQVNATMEHVSPTAPTPVQPL